MWHFYLLLPHTIPGPPKSQEQKLGSFFGKLGHSKVLSIWGSLESLMHAERKTHTQNRSEKTLRFHLRLSLGLVQAWLHVKGVPAQSQSEKKKGGGIVVMLLLLFLIKYLEFKEISVKKLAKNKPRNRDTSVTTNKEYSLCKNNLGKSLNRWSTTAFNNQEKQQNL